MSNLDDSVSFAFYANHSIPPPEAEERYLPRPVTTMKNVHFSPVVSQLRYPPHVYSSSEVPYDNSNSGTSFNGNNSDLLLNSSSDCGGDVKEGIQKVTVVQVQQVERPKLQRIQVSVPPSPTPPPYHELLQEQQGLFANQLRILNDRRHLNQLSCGVGKGEDKGNFMMAPVPIKCEDKREGNEKINNFQSVLINQNKLSGPPPPLLEELVNIQKNRNLNTVGSLEEILTSVEINAESDKQVPSNSKVWPTSTKQNQNSKQFGSNCEDNCNGNFNGNNKRRNSSSSKSFLQWISFGKLGGGTSNAKKNSKEICNINNGATKAQKRSSCPPLGHPLLLNGGIEDNGGNKDLNNYWRSESNGGGARSRNDKGENQVISLTVDNSGLSSITSKTNDLALSISPPSSSSSINSFNPTSTSTTKRSGLLPPKPSPRHSSTKRSPLPLPRLLHPSSNTTDDSEDDEFSVNFERIIEGIFQDADDDVNLAYGNTCSSYQYNNPGYLITSSKKENKMSGSKSNIASTITPLLDESANDEESQGILESMEQKIITGLSFNRDQERNAGGTDHGGEEDKEIIEGDIDIPEEETRTNIGDSACAPTSMSITQAKSKSATIPQVIGKPPIPPSSYTLYSGNKYYGGISRADASSCDARFFNKGCRRPAHHPHHLPPPSLPGANFRDTSRTNYSNFMNNNYNGNAPDTLPQAMLELAQKLVSFREELHRSREHIASSHSATLEEIHSLRTTIPLASSATAETTTAIDPFSTGPSRRSLPPHGRNTSTITTTSSITTPIFPSPQYQHQNQFIQEGSSSNFAAGASGSATGGATPGGSQVKNYFPVVTHESLITTRLQKEWDNRVLRAKEQFTRRGKRFVRGGSSSPPPHLQQEGVQVKNYCDGNKSRDPSAGGRAATTNTTTTSTTSPSASLRLLETDLDRIISSGTTTGASSGPGRSQLSFETNRDKSFENDERGYFEREGVSSTISSVDDEGKNGGGVDNGQRHVFPSATNDNLFTDKFTLKEKRNGGKSVKQNKSVISSGGSSSSSQKYYPGSLQNLSSGYFGEGESVESGGVSCASSFGYSQEDLSEGSKNILLMATLKPCEPGGEDGGKEDRSRSMEFLQDSEKNAHLLPPENTLQKSQQGGAASGERRMSEHELRIQRSLQKLNVPDWYKNYAPSAPTSAANTPSKARGGDFGGSGTGLAGGWPGLSSSKTNSLTSLQSAGRYAGSKSGFGVYGSAAGSRHSRAATTGGRSSRESLMSPSSTASASPSPNFERSSFTYGMPYALTRFAAARMSTGASPASLSPSPSPVGGIPLSSTSTPVSSGPASARYHGYQKTPYLGWRSQERLSSKSLYRSPAERLAADLIAQQKAKQSPLQTPQTPQPPPSSSLAASPAGPASGISPAQQHNPPLHQSSSSSTTPSTVIHVEPPHHQYHHHQYSGMPPPEIEVNRTSPTKSNVTSATASDLSLNNSDESNSHKLNRVRSSIKEVSNAIVDYVNETKPLDDGMNGRASPRRGLVWLESSFVGTKPIDSPSTPDTPSTFIGRGATSRDSTGAGGASGATSHFRFDTHELATSTGGGGERMPRSRGDGGGDHTESTSSTSHYTTYISRNEQMEERSNSSSVSSPTLEDILDSLLALRRPNKKFRSKQGGKGHESATSPTSLSTTAPPSSTKPSTTEYTSRRGTGGDPLCKDVITSSRHYHSSVSSSTPPSSTAATYGGSSIYTDDITGSSSHRSQSRAQSSSSPSKIGGGGSGGTPSSYQYQYQPNTSPASWLDQQQSSTTTSEIYSSSGGEAMDYLRSKTVPTTTATTASSISTSSHRSYQSDWQDRMNQPLPDSMYSYGTTSGGIDTFTSISSRYSTSSVGGGGGDNVSSPGGMSSPAISSLHSTPTHQPYNRQSSSTSQTTTTSGGAVKDSSSSPYYYSSSTHSSPAKSILGGGDRSSVGGGDITSADSNELLYRRSTTSNSGGGTTATRDPEEEDELAFGNPTEILRSSTSAAATSSNSSSTAAVPTGGTTVAPLQGGVIVNPLTGLSEYSNPPTPARHRRVSFDLDFSDKEEKSSSRSRNKEENVGGTIQCRNPKCAKTASGLEARREFKVCHNCNAYYCSRECRRAHWDKHKKTCMQSRVGAICKQIISHVKEDSYVMNQLSTSAKRGYLAKGRGVVKLFFNSPDRAERFLTGGLPELPEPLYIPHADMLPEEMGCQTFSELSDQCRSYNTDTRFVLYVCVCVVNEVPTYGAVKWERELISRSSKLRLLLPRQFFEESQRHHHYPTNPAHHFMPSASSTSQPSTSPGGDGDSASATNGGGNTSAASCSPSPSHHPHVPLYDSVPMTATSGGGDEFPAPPPPLPPPHQNTSENNDTLILRSVPPPASHQLTAAEHKRLREVSFANIQKHLLLRGVDIKRSYPDIFTKLCRYVEQDEPFLPVTIYPRNQQTGSQFVCVIMPECSDSSCSGHTSAANQEATIAAAVASAAAYSSSFAATAGAFGGERFKKDGGNGGTFGGRGITPVLQRVETINISEPGDDDHHIDLT